jgi:predicted acyl esterase
VRGRYLSEGEWEEVRPYKPGKKGTEFDESSDAYDTIDWLVKHVPCNNGRVGMWGISYPGFYALAALIDAHPALAAVAHWFDAHIPADLRDPAATLGGQFAA